MNSLQSAECDSAAIYTRGNSSIQSATKRSKQAKLCVTIHCILLTPSKQCWQWQISIHIELMSCNLTSSALIKKRGVGRNLWAVCHGIKNQVFLLLNIKISSSKVTLWLWIVMGWDKRKDHFLDKTDNSMQITDMTKHLLIRLTWVCLILFGKEFCTALTAFFYQLDGNYQLLIKFASFCEYNVQSKVLLPWTFPKIIQHKSRFYNQSLLPMEIPSNLPIVFDLFCYMYQSA